MPGSVVHNPGPDHSCGTPYHGGSIGRLVPYYSRGTIWQCEGCDQLWYVGMDIDHPEWKRLRWWNFRLRKNLGD